METRLPIEIDERDLQFDFVRASGPGGQNINKVATACQLRFDVFNARGLTAEIKARLIRLAGSRINADGILVIEARRHRTQEANREDALRRLHALIERAAVPPKARRATRPSLSARAARVDEKKRCGAVKQMRRAPAADQE